VQRQISSRFFVFEKEVAAVSPSRYSWMTGLNPCQRGPIYGTWPRSPQYWSLVTPALELCLWPSAAFEIDFFSRHPRSPIPVRHGGGPEPQAHPLQRYYCNLLAFSTHHGCECDVLLLTSLTIWCHGLTGACTETRSGGLQSRRRAAHHRGYRRRSA
jgi:hypothetical protein